MSKMVQQKQREAAEAEKAQVAAWMRWQETDSAEDQAAWERAVTAQRKAEEAVDRAEMQSDWREDRQANWWDAAWSNARAA